MARGIRDNDLRVWSAGCSTGQEPYTLAMLIQDFDSEKRHEVGRQGAGDGYFNESAGCGQKRYI